MHAYLPNYYKSPAKCMRQYRACGVWVMRCVLCAVCVCKWSAWCVPMRTPPQTQMIALNSATIALFLQTNKQTNNNAQ